MAFVQKILAFIFGGTVASVIPAADRPVSVDEMLTYDCARHVIALAPSTRQIGPVFQRLGIVLTSISSSNADKILIVNGGAGTFSIPLMGSGVNRVHFTIPVGARSEAKAFYLSFLHGGKNDSRLYDLTVDSPPSNRLEADYDSTPVRRADGLLSHLEYAIFETIENTLKLVTDKKISRQELGELKPEMCDHIARGSPSLARIMRYDLAMIATMTKEPVTPAGFRMPASVAATAR